MHRTRNSRRFDASVFARRYRRLRGDALIAETYRKYPYYAIRSDIAERVLKNDEAALSRIESARPEGTPSPAFDYWVRGANLRELSQCVTPSKCDHPL